MCCCSGVRIRSAVASNLYRLSISGHPTEECRCPGIGFGVPPQVTEKRRQIDGR
jgi:hypothetical protein